MTKPSQTGLSPLAPLSFNEKRVGGEPAVDLTFVPTHKDLLDGYEKLWVETTDCFGCLHSPVNTVTTLLKDWLVTNANGIGQDGYQKNLFDSAFEVISFLDYASRQAHEISFLRQQAKEVTEFVEAQSLEQKADSATPNRMGQ